MIWRFVQEFFLISVPLAAVSVFFFIGEVPAMGVFFALLTLATLWYIRPRKLGPPKPPELVSLEDPPPPSATGASTTSGPPTV